jgi:hypothetical protein
MSSGILRSLPRCGPRVDHPLDARVAIPVVALAFLRVDQDLVGLKTLLEPGLRVLVADVPIRVMLPGQLAEGALDLFGARILRDAEDLVIVALRAGHAVLRSQASGVRGQKPAAASCPRGISSILSHEGRFCRLTPDP